MPSDKISMLSSEYKRFTFLCPLFISLKIISRHQLRLKSGKKLNAIFAFWLIS